MQPIEVINYCGCNTRNFKAVFGAIFAQNQPIYHMFLNQEKKFASIDEMAAYGKQRKLLLVSYQKDVFDVSHFAAKHPGGNAVLETWRGQSVDNVIFNKKYFNHSKGILQKLIFYKIGTIQDTLLQKTQESDRPVTLDGNRTKDKEETNLTVGVSSKEQPLNKPPSMQQKPGLPQGLHPKNNLDKPQDSSVDQEIHPQISKNKNEQSEGVQIPQSTSKIQNNSAKYFSTKEEDEEEEYLRKMISKMDMFKNIKY